MIKSSIYSLRSGVGAFGSTRPTTREEVEIDYEWGAFNIESRCHLNESKFSCRVGQDRVKR